MIIAGLEKLTLLDYPGKLSAIVFTYGCDMRCPYCHNPELVVGELNRDSVYSTDQVLEFLSRRVGKLDALVITGGEPTIHNDLENFIMRVKELGFLVKLDTNGGNPKRIEKIISMQIVDYWAMDVKYSPDDYEAGINGGRKISREDVKKSIALIMNSGVDYEFRSTIVKGFHDERKIKEIGRMVKGSKRFFIQNFRPDKHIDSNLNSSNSFNSFELKVIAESLNAFALEVQVRGSL